MTEGEAIEILEEVKLLDDSMYQYNQSYMDALDMAIEALKKTGEMVERMNEAEKDLLREFLDAFYCAGNDRERALAGAELCGVLEHMMVIGEKVRGK